MTVFSSSDWHIGHQFVGELRGFDSVEAHDEAIIENVRSVVTKHDQLWLHGDLVASSGQLPRALDLVKSLPCECHFIWGNHDAGHPMHRNAHKKQRQYLDAFASVQPFARRKINGVNVLLSHFPYTADRGPARYMQYRLRDEGEWLLHGHTHGPERFHDQREIHIGVDAWDLRPVPLEEIAKIIAEVQEG